MILLGRIFMEIFAQNKEEKRKNQTERKKKSMMTAERDGTGVLAKG